MGFLILGEDEDVVHVDYDPSLVDHVFEEGIHHCLEGCWRVAKSEEHDHWFEEASMRLERGFPLVSIFDPHVVVSGPEVELGEYLCALEFVD